ncbi:hypothetical protein TRIUR3_11225 [Triticum urartu]|uniref:Uncharacterized protein n=1 Tax=Triticum urartu TaxID=4572 RepID=M7YXJ9_TRIUA|nr:hypothetical protein TRIUR3_11225 [Triticum urartu]
MRGEIDYMMETDGGAESERLWREAHLVNRLLEGVEAPTLKDMNLLLKMYGIAPGNTEALLFEITKMVESYMQQAELALPPAYDVTWFCNQFLGVDSFPSLRDTFADLHFKGRQSFTWNAGFVNFYNEIWRAEDSPPGSVGGGKSVPNAWQSLVELIYDFVLNLEILVPYL